MIPSYCCQNILVCYVGPGAFLGLLTQLDYLQLPNKQTRKGKPRENRDNQNTISDVFNIAMH